MENPGNITVSKASVLNDAIDFAGGTKTLKGPVKFLRFNNDGSIDKRKFKYRKINQEVLIKIQFLGQET